MQSTANIENVSISIPITDLSFLRTLSKKMGWTIKRPRKSGIDRALDDIKAGRVYEAKSVDDLFDQLEHSKKMGWKKVKSSFAKKESWVDQFAGKWQDNRSTDEIIADIHNARTSNDEISL